MSQARPSTPSPRQPPDAGSAATPDYAAIKQRQQATWASGDFAIIGVTLQIVGESLAEAADIRAGERVIDIAAGNGNATLAAARRFAHVTSTDYVPALLEKGRARAAAEGLHVEFREADAEALPFYDGSFDVALSTFGVMFAPDHARCAGEMMRVVRGGGRIGLASWTPEGFIGQLFKTVGRHVPPPAGLVSPAMWGKQDYLRQLFGSEAASIRAQPRIFNFRYASAAHMIQVFRDYYGPVHKAFAALDPGGRQALEQDLTELLERWNVAGDNSLVVPAEYLEALVIKRTPEVLH
ncbi:class I SAM-dependent methyltransferase [Massilia sp. X63]|uniref:class I SAM-dependent methyltransferase n=1 Tax=Massilia sp. X63 TaxID=3237285 RepID=UPI0034DD2064